MLYVVILKHTKLINGINMKVAKNKMKYYFKIWKTKGSKI